MGRRGPLSWTQALETLRHERVPFTRARVSDETAVCDPEFLGVRPPVSLDEPRRLLRIPRHKTCGIKRVAGDLDRNHLGREDAERVAYGVAVEIPKMVTNAFVLGPATWANIHRSAGADKAGSVLLRVKRESDLSLTPDCLHEQLLVYHALQNSARVDSLFGCDGYEIIAHRAADAQTICGCF